VKHNIVVLSQGGSDRPNLGVILPFDFDYAGLVNADYAVPYEGLGLASVRDRKYLGICREKEVFIKELKEFLEKKEEFYKVINEFPYLKEKSKKEMINYLDGFFYELNKPDIISFKLLRECIDF
jgi:hypothetical protein